MLKKFLDRLEGKMIVFLSKVSYIALMLVGLVILFLLFREVYNMIILSLHSGEPEGYYRVLESILSFFIFFEFLTLIITSLKRRGNVSLIFLLSLGITALIRFLIIYHEQIEGVILVSVAILLLIIGIILLKRFIFANDKNEEHF